MKKIRKSIMCLFICITLIISGMTCFPATAMDYIETEDGIVSTVEESLFEFEKFPEVVTTDSDFAEKVVMRADSNEEPLNVIKYFMNDGTYSMNIFPIDVKYTDYDGVVRDKSNKIYDLWSLDAKTIKGKNLISEDLPLYEYVSKDNDIVTKYPSKISDGVVSLYDDIEIKIYPEYCNPYAAEAKITDDTVIYENAFCDGIDIKYNSTFTGVKDDIIVNENLGIEEFEFICETNGLSVDKTEGIVGIYDGDNMVSSFGDVFVYDSNHKSVYGTLSCETIVENQKYRITINVPVDFMQAEDTQYPVIIDPIIYFAGRDFYSGRNISETYIAMNYSDFPGSLISAPNIRLTQSQAGLVKFPNLVPVLNDIGENFKGSSLYFYTWGAPEVTDIAYAKVCPQTVDWEVMTTLSQSEYLSILNGYDSSYETLSVGIRSTSTFVQVNLTNIFQNCKSGSYVSGDLHKGIRMVLTGGGSDANVLLHTSNTYDASKYPRLLLSYNDYESDSIVSGGIYMISPYATKTTVSSYNLASTGSGIQLKAGSVASRNYPKTNSGYVSTMYSLDNLFKVEYTGYGYTFKNLSNGKYLNNSLTFSDADDTHMYSTRWYIVDVGGKYYICEYFYSYLHAANPTTSNSAISILPFTTSSGCYWKMQLYSLDVTHDWQDANNTCGAASAKMILDYLGADVSNLSDATIRNKGFELLDNPDYGNEHIQLSLNYYCNLLIGQNFYPDTYRYATTNSMDSFQQSIVANVNAGYPVIMHIEFDGITMPPFNYNTDGHFIVITGLYVDLSGQTRVVIVDPHYDSEPGNGGSAVIDVPLNIVYLFKKSTTLIRNVA
ncbi:MAG: hypothetical protein E7384_04760 [Ruminococcaceae bacterium]|nr:hypothetical protein [Oscillospiraceae bacterium]